MQLQFLGATGTVTGSKYLLTLAQRRLMIDCGLFQGLKQLRLKNWADLPVDPASIDTVILTHAHIDHSGYLPVLVRQGFTGKIYCSHATMELCKILLPDSAHLQEEEAAFANKRGFSRHQPALPLYTRADAEAALQHFCPMGFDQEVALGDGITLKLLPNGHILGSSFVQLRAQQRTIVFSGDIGRPDDVLMFPPASIRQADYLILESTYGNRTHSTEDPELKLAQIIQQTVKRKGVIIVPVFAVGRAQELLYYIHRLKASGSIPADLPVYLNSPMAVEATQIYRHYHDQHRLNHSETEILLHTAHMVESIEASKHLNTLSGPMIILSASGMASGGRVIHHLAAFAPEARNTILFVGFQAAGTRGYAMLEGSKTIKIHGEYVPVRAQVASISNLSAHADYTEILRWLQGFEKAPRQTFITHGEPVAADAMRMHIKDSLHWAVTVPEYLQTVTLD
ncbi:MAG TPA: MBL fold metallo-hydrolase [Methylophilus sp.]